MFKISNFTDNDDVTVLKEFGAFKTIEWKRDLSVNEASAMERLLRQRNERASPPGYLRPEPGTRHRSGRRHAMDGRQRNLHHRR